MFSVHLFPVSLSLLSIRLPSWLLTSSVSPFVEYLSFPLLVSAPFTTSHKQCGRCMKVMGAGDIQLKPQSIIIISQFPLYAVSRSPSDYITAQCHRSQPVEDKLRGSSPVMQLSDSGLSPAACVLPVTPPPSPHPPSSLCHIHPPALPLPAFLTHTYTQTLNHECTGIAAAPRDGDLRCVCECLFPVSAGTRANECQ